MFTDIILNETIGRALMNRTIKFWMSIVVTLTFGFWIDQQYDNIQKRSIWLNKMVEIKQKELLFGLQYILCILYCSIALYLSYNSYD